ncbi:MAG: protein phosphatase 2C domain-containing protein [Pirellulales bacterium]|nr:protein phosphatase 2C domain-containing protein [Pirellulales bacterium]
MSKPFECETAWITEGYRSPCEDVVEVVTTDDGVLVVVADGAGGSGGGAEAASMVVTGIKSRAGHTQTADSWCQVLREIDAAILVGESTAVAVYLSENGIQGASVGDSRAWIIRHGNLVDLTSDQRRKPLLGSGEAVPVGFSTESPDGLLIVATDGFCNYVKQPDLFKTVEHCGTKALPAKLLDLVRLPSGALWDDVGIAVVRRKRPPTRYSGRIELAFEDF